MHHERILVVDDEASARAALLATLKEEGYEVAEAHDGEQALALLGSFHPVAVLSDVHMPKLDGIGLLKAAREVAPPDLEVRDAPALLNGCRIGCLPVVEGGELVGIVTRSDLIRLLST